MAQNDAVFAGAIPEFYNRHLEPLLLEPYATDLAGRLTNITTGRVLARTPCGYHDVDGIRRELAQAGFSLVEVETVQQFSRAASPGSAVIGLCQGTPLRNEIEARDPAGLEAATDAAAKAIVSRFGSGPISAKMQAHIITASV